MKHLEGHADTMNSDARMDQSALTKPTNVMALKTVRIPQMRMTVVRMACHSYSVEYSARLRHFFHYMSC